MAWAKLCLRLRARLRLSLSLRLKLRSRLRLQMSADVYTMQGKQEKVLAGKTRAGHKNKGVRCNRSPQLLIDPAQDSR